MSLITVDQAKVHIRGGAEIDDDELEEYVLAAEQMILNYLKEASPYVAEVDSAGDPLLDSSDEVIYTTDVRYEVQTATKILTGYLWRHRDDNEGEAFDRGYLPKPVTAILFPLRDPALA